jgi:hypothetical protein
LLIAALGVVQDSGLPKFEDRARVDRDNPFYRSLLDAAGFEKGDDGKYVVDDEKPNIRLAVCRRFTGAVRSASRIASISGINGPSFGLSGGRCRTYPGGIENRHIFETVSRLNPKIRAASRRLLPSLKTNC